MSAPANPLVDVTDIVRLVGRRAFDRGRGYARDGAVLEFEWEAATARLVGVVRGSRAKPYSCRVHLGAEVNGFARLLGSECDCPLTGDCKHVAATLLRSNAEHLRAQGSSDRWTARPTSRGAVPGGAFSAGAFSGGAFSGGDSPGGPAGEAASGDAFSAGAASSRAWTFEAADDSPPMPLSWRTAVDQLSGAGGSPEPGPGAASGGRRGSAAGPTAMGLQFEVRVVIPRTPDRWRGPTARAATADDPESLTRHLAVRPAIRGENGGYVKGAVTWASFAYQVNRLGLDERHHRWFAQFAALHRATRGTTIGHDADWLVLDDFASPILWHLLGEAERLGIALVATKKGVVAIGGTAAVGLDASSSGSPGARSSSSGSADADPDASASTSTSTAPGSRARNSARGGDLVLTPIVTIDDEPQPIATSGAIGDHGVYSYGLAPRPMIVIAPTRTPLWPQQRALLGPSDPLVVPAGEVGEFLEDFAPRLRRAIELTARDGTVELPEVVPPVLVLRAAFGKKHELRLDWSWRYAPDQLVVFRKPDAPDDGTASAALHDDAAERKILDRVRDALAAADAERCAARRADGPGASDAGPGGSDTGSSGTGGSGTSSSAPAAPGADAGQHLTGTRGQHPTGAPEPRVAQDFEPIGRAPEWPPEPSVVLGSFDAAVFAEHTLPVLESVDGVRVEIVGERPEYRELTGAPELTVTAVESDKRDWFDLGVIVHLDGYRIPFGPLFAALSHGRRKLMMVDGAYLSLAHPAFDRLRELLDEADALGEWETGPRISRYQASLWADFEDLADESEQAVAWREAAAGLSGITSVESAPLPEAVRAELRPYQLDGFHWAAFLWKHRLGGILADDMGLGKTLQTLALIAHAHETTPEVDRRPFLVVAPTSVVPNWLAEAARFTPGLTVRGITATEAKSRTTIAKLAAGADIVVTSYALFRLDAEAYRDRGWAGLVLDEAQFAKNHRAKVHECAVQLDAPFKLAITGTPMENNLMELWSLFAIVSPGLFPSAAKFAERYVKPIQREPDAALLETLRRRIRPFLMRRTKELVAPELPAKQEQVLQVELAPKHRKLYDATLQRERQKLLGLIEDLDRNRFIVFRSLTLLRMLSLDASLVDEQHADIPSAKLDALLEQLGEVVAEGHRTLIFSQFTSFLQKAAARLDAQGIAYEYLDGSSKRRADIVDRFREGEAPVFLISLKAGGFGLNLTQADYVFLLDPWWNPATEEQAIDRTHRIGQTGNVMVYRLVAADTIEEKVMALKAKKARLFDAVLDDDAVFSSALTADDIRSLLDT